MTHERGIEIAGRITSSSGRGLEGVSVSDGETVALSDGKGRYAIRDARPGFVWVSRPDGYECSSWFARSSEPGGRFDFELVPADHAPPFRFAQLTDTHMSTVPEPARVPFADSPFGVDDDGNLAHRPLTSPGQLSAAIDLAVGTEQDVRFALLTGDLTDHGTFDEFVMLAEVAARSPVPVHAIAGNHDHYGHLHAAEERDDPVDSRGMGTATFWRWEAAVGPRWWSLTRGGLRIVAVDWFSHRLGIDRVEQERWLAADLHTAPEGTPVLLLSHDQMPRDFFDRLRAAAPHVRLLGSLSGHWHTSRVVRVDGALHVNTGNATFGGFDWHPPHVRLFRWDGESLAMRTVVAGGPAALDRVTFGTVPSAQDPVPEQPGRPRWSATLPGACHLAEPAAIADGGVVVAWSDDDRAVGGLTAFDADSGELRWDVVLEGPVKAGVVWAGGESGDADDPVVAVTVHGAVTAADPLTGEVRWKAQIGDPLMMWVHPAPVIFDGKVASGAVPCYAALSLADGSRIWERNDLSNPENVSTYGAGTYQGETLVFGFGLFSPNTFGLDPATGETRWVHEPEAASPGADFLRLPDGQDVVVMRLGGGIERIDAATGERRWRGRLDAAFPAGQAVVLGELLVASTGVGSVHGFDVESGERIWSRQLGGEALVPMGPYRRAGQACPAGPVVAGDSLVQVAADGRVHRIAADGTDAVVMADLGVPLTAEPVVVGGQLVVATSGGTVLALPLGS
ncbi:MAG: 3',5'-cyclic adenosine monophosphate phosphodiesterase CpdA [Acidimicrobiales bacterium]|nr:MAG: hypothetical protein EDR02_10635 [Actinomycetota bacterium]MBV6507768.1 3',5'-cyclic adenosine monophosphate phosphodiesterase CpdA [Acidimicrobiales bacterium]RIK05926.1 MAG: hypothetical protein DCC48_08175 [Acidobacteriota bacterium]